jgi:hypothetical protein
VGGKRISTIVIDEDARPEELEAFRAAGFNVIVARVGEEDALQNLA